MSSLKKLRDIQRKTKSQLIGIIQEKAQTLVLLDKDCKSVTINIFRELKEIMSKRITESIRIIPH